MMPPIIKLEDLDPGIMHLVINLSRVLIIDSNCEGHERFAPPIMPTKLGWIWINRRRGEHEELIRNLRHVCSRYKFSFFDDALSLRGENFQTYFVHADFEPFEEDGSNPFEDWSKRDQQNYMRRARRRKLGILKFWDEMNTATVDYLKRKYGENWANMPFYEKKSAGSSSIIGGSMCSKF